MSLKNFQPTLKKILDKTMLILPLVVFVVIAVLNYCIKGWTSPFIKNLVYIGTSGGIGGTISSVLIYYRFSSDDINAEFNYLKNLFVPVISSLFGIFTFFHIYGGLFLINNINSELSKQSILFYCSLAFVVGLLVAFVCTKKGWGVLRNYLLNKTTLSGIYLFLILVIYVLIAIYSYFKVEGSMIKTLILASVSGGLGGAVDCIIDYYVAIGEGQPEIYKWSWWYFFRPITSAVLGAFTFFLIYAGLLVINNTPQSALEVRSIILYSALSFVVGYSYLNFFTFIENLANIILKEPSGKEGASKNKENQSK